MPVRDQVPPHKKRKVDASSKRAYKYVSASDIRRAFKAQSEAGLIEGTPVAQRHVLVLGHQDAHVRMSEGLTALRNQLTVRSDEPPVQVNDERLLLAQAWLDDDRGAQDLFAAWESANAVRSFPSYLIPAQVQASNVDRPCRGKALSSQLLLVFSPRSSRSSPRTTPTMHTLSLSSVPCSHGSGHNNLTHTSAVSILIWFWSR